MKRQHRNLPAIMAGLLLLGCQQEPTTSVTDNPTYESSPDDTVTVPTFETVDQLSEQQKQQHGVALAARDVLFTKLSGRLMTAIEADGPAAAIDVCKSEATAIAEQVKQELGVNIGRTSFKLRNSMDPPPDWAKGFVSQRTDSPRFVALPDEALGVLLPIPLQQKCTLCHGPQEELAPDVKAALQRHYPNDEATGFREGDLRGWLWIEVPAAGEAG